MADPTRPARVTPAIAEQFRQLGVRVKAAKVEGDGREVIKVWDMNWDALRAFLALATQWRVAPLTTLERARLVRLGLEYQAIPTVLGLLGLPSTPRLFAQLQILEREALAAFGAAS